jgi:plastocyanin
MHSRCCLLLTLVLLSACSSPPPPPPPAGGGKHVDPATAGAITGKVTFAGAPPKPDMLRMNTDPACAQASGERVPSDAVLVGADGAVQNAFVYIKDGVDPAYSFDVPATSVVLDQKGCRYVPRIIGMRVGQTIEITNSDATLHNVHALPMANQEFNYGQKEGTPSFKRTFTVPEVMVRFMCNVHGWMTAYVGVMAHPFFAVTGPDGAFEIKGLPPGTYTVGAWHETLGAQTQQVTVADRETKTAAFVFKPQ